MLRSALVLALLAFSAPAFAEPETPPASRDNGLFGARAGLVNLSSHRGVDAMELSAYVQPYRGRDVAVRGLYAGARVSLDPWSDFSSFERYGGELGYLHILDVGPPWLRLGGSAGFTVDSWDVWDDDDETPQGSGVAAGIIVRPFVRVGFLELSVPVERGYATAVSRRYATYSFQLGLALF